MDKIHYTTRKPFRTFLWCHAYDRYISGTRSSVPRIYTQRIIAMIRADRSGPSIPFAEAYCESVQAAHRATYQAASEPARNERWLVHYIVRALCTRNKSMPLTKAMWKLIGHSRWDLDRDCIQDESDDQRIVCLEVEKKKNCICVHKKEDQSQKKWNCEICLNNNRNAKIICMKNSSNILKHYYRFPTIGLQEFFRLLHIKVKCLPHVWLFLLYTD